MQRVVSLLVAALLVLMVWTGGPAHAAERVNCVPLTAEAGIHSDGDQDQAPPSPQKSTAHHHSGCAGHYLAVTASESSVEIRVSDSMIPLAWREFGKPSRGPDDRLRPPIA